MRCGLNGLNIMLTSYLITKINLYIDIFLEIRQTRHLRFDKILVPSNVVKLLKNRCHVMALISQVIVPVFESVGMLLLYIVCVFEKINPVFSRISSVLSNNEKRKKNSHTVSFSLWQEVLRSNQDQDQFFSLLPPNSTRAQDF